MNVLVKQDFGEAFLFSVSFLMIRASELAGVLPLALVSVELLLKVCLRVRCPLERIHRYFEVSVTECAGSGSGNRTKPLDYSKITLLHGRPFARCFLGGAGCGLRVAGVLGAGDCGCVKVQIRNAVQFPTG